MICNLEVRDIFEYWLILPSGLIKNTWHRPLFISRGHRLKFSNNIVFLSLKIIFVLANSVDTDEMLLYTVFHLCLHYFVCLI